MDGSLTARARDIQLVVFDFDGVFTDNRVLVLEDGRVAVLCNRPDGLGIERARAAGLNMLVLSKEQNPVVGARCRKLKLVYIQGCDDKATRLQQLAHERGIALARIAYLGNDVNDLPCLKLVGLPACVADAYPEIVPHCLLVTKKPGGYGAVREFCDFMLAAQGLLPAL